MRRLLALLGALLMVAVALLVRSLVAGDDDDGSGGGGGDGPLALLCAPELAPVCDDLEGAGLAEVTVEDIGVTVDRLGQVDADLDVDAWLTLDPFPAQVDERRRFATGDDLFTEVAATGHGTGLALVAFDDRGAALEGWCPEVGWACVGDAAGEPWADHGGEAAWGSVRPGYDAPDRSGSGLLVLAQAMADHLDDPGFAAQDIDTPWLGDLEDAVPTRTGPSALLTLVQQGRAAYGAVGALGVDAERAAATAQGQDLVIFYPAPMFRANVVVASAPGSADAVERLVGDERLADALAEAGWDADGGGDALPSAGVLDALRSAWEAS